MAIDSSLRKEMTEFLIDLPLLQNKEGRQATLLSAGLQEALPHIDLSGSSYEFVARLIERLETYTTLSDGQFALICFLQEIGNQLGQNHQETLRSWCQHLQSQLKPRPIAVLKSQRPISYLAPFQAPPLPGHFVPRPEVTDALKARLLKDESTTPGILVVSAIHGLGGIGKSTLAAALTYDKDVQERFPDGILWATLGQQPEILSLISGWIHEMRDYDFRPTTIEAASAHLRALLQDKAVLLVVDDVWNPEHAIHFKVGGPRCQVLITTRRADVADEVGAELHQMDVMTPEQSLELLAARLQRPLEAAERDEALSLAEAVGYLPLALELAAVRVARGMTWTALCEALEQETANLNALEGSPRRRRKGATTLEACFNFSLNALRSEDEEAWNAFVWLGVLPEDVQIAAPMAATLWEMEQTEAHDLLELLWNDALLFPGSPILVGDKEYPAYRLHDLLHDIVRKLLTINQPQGLGFTIQGAHTALLERYKQRTQNGLWHTLPDDGYIHSHLIWHFQQAGQTDQIHTLLWEETEDGRNGWYQSREQLGQTAGFLDDVNLAWKLAEKENNIGLQCRYALMIVSFNSMAQNIPNKLLTMLVQYGIWSPNQGLAYVLQGHRIEGLIELSPYLPRTLRNIALRDALTITQTIVDKEVQARALIELAPHLPNALQKDALIAVQTLEDEGARTQALIELAPRLPDTLRKDVLTAAQEIKDERARAQALTELIPHLSGPLREFALQDALTTARAIKDRETWAQTLAELVPHLSDTRREAVLQDALTATHEIEDDWERMRVVLLLASYLPNALLQDALATTRKIEEGWAQAWILTELAPKLPVILLQDALTTAREIENDWDRAKALTGLTPYLPDGLLPDALIVAQEIKDGSGRAKALTELAPRLSEVLQEIVLQDALTSVKEIEDDWQRAVALIDLAPHLPDEALPDALNTAREIKDGSGRAKALTELAPRLSEVLQETTLQDAMKSVEEIEDRWEITEALTELVPHLPDTLLPDALTIAQRIADWNVRMEALLEFAPRLPDSSRTSMLREILTATQVIWDMDRWERVLVSLASHLPDTLLQDALITAQGIEDEKVRAWALTELAPHLPNTLLQDALDTAQGIEDGWAQAQALTELADRLPATQRKSVLQDVLTTAQAIEDERVQAWALIGLASHPLAPLLQDVLTTAQAIEDDKVRAQVLTELIPHLQAPHQKSVLQDALTAVQAIEDDWDRAWALIGLAPCLTPPLRRSLQQDFLATAQGIKDEGTRTRALTELIPHLSDELQKSILQDALTTAQGIEDKALRVEALTGLAPHLLSDALRESVLQNALTSAQEIEDKALQAEALTGLASHLLSDALWESVLQNALTSAQEIEDGWDRTKALIELLPYLPAPLLESVLKDALTKAQGLEDEGMRRKVLTKLAQQLIKHPATELLSLWHSLLKRLAQRSRRDLLSDLRVLAPVIAKLGGDEAIVELFHAIQDVGRWWP